MQLADVRPREEEIREDGDCADWTFVVRLRRSARAGSLERDGEMIFSHGEFEMFGTSERAFCSTLHARMTGISSVVFET